MLTISSSNSHFVEKYYNAEKQDSFVVVTAGIAAIAFAVVLLLGFREDFYFGMSAGLLVLSAIYTYATMVVYLRSDKLQQEVMQQINSSQFIQQQEVPRVQNSISVLTLFQWGEGIAIAIGTILLLYFWPRSGQHFWSGLGTAMAVQGLLLLSFHSVIIRRSKDYLLQLENVEKGETAGPSFDDKVEATGW